MEGQAGLGTALRRGTLEFCVLALLESEPRYGVELVARLGTESALTTTEGTLYPLLSRLRRAGWLETTWQESPTGPPRRYYGLSGPGKAALAHFRAEWTTFRDAVDRIVGNGANMIQSVQDRLVDEYLAAVVVVAGLAFTAFLIAMLVGVVALAMPASG